MRRNSPLENSLGPPGELEAHPDDPMCSPSTAANSIYQEEIGAMSPRETSERNLSRSRLRPGGDLRAIPRPTIGCARSVPKLGRGAALLIALKTGHRDPRK